MGRLTKEHLRYLKQHSIDVEETFDASGLKRAEYRPRMKAEGKFVAYGVTRCQNGHGLRNRYGTCIVSVGWRPQIRRLRRSVADLAASTICGRLPLARAERKI